VAFSSLVRFTKASLVLAPHISMPGRRRAQTAGRSGLPKSRQRASSVSCTQRTPAGFPSGMPGIGLEIEGATQHAPHPALHSILRSRPVLLTQDCCRV
jgi:hypothetical protein